MTDPDTIVLAAANGMSVRDIATAYGLSDAEVRAVIDQEAARCFDGKHLRREWLLEAKRLDALGAKYYAKAMAGDGDINSAAIYIKASERKAALTGMNAPLGHSVMIMHQNPPEQITSTQRIRLALDRVKGISPEERARLDQEEEEREAAGRPPEPPQRSATEEAIDRLRGKTD